MKTFVKRSPGAPPDFFGCEAAGLSWIGGVEGGVRCAQVLGHDATGLTLEYLEETAPTACAAEAFGRALAHTHNAGAQAFGSPPARWRGDGFFGPMHRPLPMSYGRYARWGEFYARERLQPMLERAGTALGVDTAATVEEVMNLCIAGTFDDADLPVRLHGDLWAGNVMWTHTGAVLIDPAAHGGHRETDLAMLALFGCPHLETILAGYQQVQPLRERWRDRVGLHQLYPLLAHVVLFGGGYRRQVAHAARVTLEIS
jgi:fructosamine-3-kinase